MMNKENKYCSVLGGKKAYLVPILCMVLLILLSGTAYSYDKQVVNDDHVYIEAPTLISTSGDYDFQFMTKQFNGQVNYGFLINTDVLMPSNSRLVTEQLRTVPHTKTCYHDIGYELNPNYAWCYMDENGTYEVYWNLSFDSGDLPSKTIYWNTYEPYEVETNINQVWNKRSINLLGYNTAYYVTGVQMNPLESRNLRVHFNVPLGVDAKYDLVTYPSSYGNDLIGAYIAGVLYRLDPFFNTTRYYIGNGTGQEWSIDENAALTNISYQDGGNTFTLGTLGEGFNVTAYYSWNSSVSTDDTGNGYTATGVGGITITTDDFVLGGASLNTTPALDYLKLPQSISVGGATSHAFSFWIRGAGSNNNDRFILAQDGNGTESFIVYSTGSGTVLYRLRNGTVPTTTSITSTATINNSGWHFVCGGWNGTDMFLVVNDSLEGTASLNLVPTYHPSGVWVGDRQAPGSGIQSPVDELAFWINESINETDCYDIYNSGAGLMYEDFPTGEFNSSQDTYRSRQLNASQEVFQFTPNINYTANGFAVTLNVTCDLNETATWGVVTNGQLTSCPSDGKALAYEITLTGNKTVSPLVRNLTLDLVFSFDNNSPTISNVTTAVTETTARIWWETNESANGSVAWGLSPTSLTKTAVNTSFGLNKSIYLSGLNGSQTYYFNVTACDASDNCNTTGIFNFTTTAKTLTLDAYDYVNKTLLSNTNFTVDINGNVTEYNASGGTVTIVVGTLDTSNITISRDGYLTKTVTDWNNTLKLRAVMFQAEVVFDGANRVNGSAVTTFNVDLPNQNITIFSSPPIPGSTITGNAGRGIEFSISTGTQGEGIYLNNVTLMSGVEIERLVLGRIAGPILRVINDSGPVIQVNPPQLLTNAPAANSYYVVVENITGNHVAQRGARPSVYAEKNNIITQIFGVIGNGTSTTASFTYNIDSLGLQWAQDGDDGDEFTVNSGALTVEFNKTDYYDLNQTYTITGATNTTQTWDAFDHKLNLTVNVINGSGDNMSWGVIIYSDDYAFNETLTTITGELIANLTDGNYTVQIDASQFVPENFSVELSEANMFTNYTMNVTTGNVVTLNFYREDDQTLIVGPNISGFFTGDVVATAFSTVTGVETITNLTADDYVITYSAPGYSQREYFYTHIAQARTTIDLYLINDSEDTIITSSVVDDLGNDLNNATIKLQKKNLAGADYFLVEMCKTAVQGQCLLHVDLQDTTYRAQIEYDGETKLITDDFKFQSTEVTFVINLNVNALTKFYDLENIRYNFSSVNNSDNETVNYTFTWNDVNGHTLEGCLETTGRIGARWSSIQKDCVSSASGTILQTINFTSYEETRSAASVQYEGSINLLILAYLAASYDLVPQRFGQAGLFIFGIIVLITVIMAMTTLPNPGMMIPIGSVAMLAVLYFTGFIGLTLATIIGLIILAVLVAILVSRK